MKKIQELVEDWYSKAIREQDTCKGCGKISKDRPERGMCLFCDMSIDWCQCDVSDFCDCEKS